MTLRELKLNRRQRLYVEGVAAGKSRRRAALDAGYSLSSANNPAHNIERGRVREVFAELIRSTVPPELKLSSTGAVPIRNLDLKPAFQWVLQKSPSRSFDECE